ncbi:MAG: universal stress protein [Candidatus Sphingomonas colombiensis]|nr:universal stress protein [Sphingomonas sp.]WEK43216.1 MAG: universal stress protein [Sphingomonas sp.]
MVADVLAILDLGSADAGFVAQAVQFASTRNAHLTIAVSVLVNSFEASLAKAGGYPIADNLRASVRAKKDALIAQFAHIAILCYEGDTTEIVKILAARTSISDLALFGPPSGYGDTYFRRRALEHLALCSGRPVLIVPPSGVADRFEHIVLGWNGTREASRALNDALPLLERNARVDVVAVSPADAPIALEPLCEHLRRSEFVVEPHLLTGTDPTGDQLLRFVEQRQAQLLAIGAFAHSRFEEIMLGGVTRDLIEDASVPILFSH